MRQEPVLTDGAFDSQNVAFWDSERKCYVAIYRDFLQGVRTIKCANSQDFLTRSTKRSRTGCGLVLDPDQGPKGLKMTFVRHSRMLTGGRIPEFRRSAAPRRVNLSLTVLTLVLGYLFSFAFPARHFESLRGLVREYGEDGVTGTGSASQSGRN